jgi:hypothetical protein
MTLQEEGIGRKDVLFDCSRRFHYLSILILSYRTPVPSKRLETKDYADLGWRTVSVEALRCS